MKIGTGGFFGLRKLSNQMFLVKNGIGKNEGVGKTKKENDAQVFDPDEEIPYKDARSDEENAEKRKKNSQHRKLWTVTFTSEVLQTLADEEAIFCLPTSTSPTEIPGADKKSKNNVANCINDRHFEEKTKINKVPLKPNKQKWKSFGVQFF